MARRTESIARCCRSSAPCTNPFEIYSAVMDFLAQEDDVTMTGKLVEQLRTNMERTVMQNSTQQILTMLNKLVLDVKDFNNRYAGRQRLQRKVCRLFKDFSARYVSSSRMSRASMPSLLGRPGRQKQCCQLFKVVKDFNASCVSSSKM
jgi:hypothetical protein